MNVVHNETVLRPDIVAQDNTREELLRNVPDKENGYIRVPPLLKMEVREPNDVIISRKYSRFTSKIS